MKFTGRNWRSIIGVALATLFFRVSMPVFSASPPENKIAPPPDLLLDKEQVSLSKSLAHYAWGLFLLLQEQNRTATVQHHLVEALRHNPDSRYLLEQAAAGWLIEDDAETLIKKLTPIARQNPSSVYLQILVANNYRETGRVKQAVDLLEHAFLENKVYKPLLMRELAALYWDNKNYAQLSDLLRKARKIDSLQAQFITYYTLAEFHNSLSENPEGADLSKRQIAHHNDQALVFAEKAESILRKAPSPSDLMKLADVFAELGKNRVAIELLSTAQDAYPDLGPLLNIRSADYYQALGESGKALSLLSSVDIKAIKDPRLLIQLGQSFMALNNVEGAVKCYERVIKMAPRAKRLRSTLAYLYLHQGTPQAVLRLFNSREEGLTPDSLLLISRAHYQLGDLQEADAWLDRAVKKAKTQKQQNFLKVDYYLYRATLYEETGNIDKAVATARKALDQAPDNPVVTNFLGYVMADHNRNLKEAEMLIKQALEKDPNSGAYLDSLAWVYYRQGRFKEALAEINKALRQPDLPSDPVALDHAGDIYAANGYDLIASRYWWSALRHEPGNAADIRAKLK
ncbi:MAG: tetratricopeptide repeat protein [Lentisphaeria bacterium]